MVIGVQWLFVILFVAIGFGVHTHPPKEYYASPVPVSSHDTNYHKATNIYL